MAEDKDSAVQKAVDLLQGVIGRSSTSEQSQGKIFYLPTLDRDYFYSL